MRGYINIRHPKWARNFKMPLVKSQRYWCVSGSQVWKESISKRNWSRDSTGAKLCAHWKQSTCVVEKKMNKGSGQMSSLSRQWVTGTKQFYWQITTGIRVSANEYCYFKSLITFVVVKASRIFFSFACFIYTPRGSWLIQMYHCLSNIVSSVGLFS